MQLAPVSTNIFLIEVAFALLLSCSVKDIKVFSTSGWYLDGISILSGADKSPSMEWRLIFSFFFSSPLVTQGGSKFTFSWDRAGDRAGERAGELLRARPRAVGRSPLPRLTFGMIIGTLVFLTTGLVQRLLEGDGTPKSRS